MVPDVITIQQLPAGGRLTPEQAIEFALALLVQALDVDPLSLIGVVKREEAS